MPPGSGHRPASMRPLDSPRTPSPQRSRTFSAKSPPALQGPFVHVDECPDVIRDATGTANRNTRALSALTAPLLVDQQRVDLLGPDRRRARWQERSRASSLED